ncbi:hypothetical protein M3Y94_01036800 [Aphelenchoides besseyi]|nr:hypothetical protein M3Y94_01036800 [Aphelenchoides besseyi]
MEDVRDLIPANTTLRKRYQVIRRLGQGSFGQVFAGQKVLGENQHMVAIKLEKRFRKANGFDDPRRMVIEQKVLILLRGKPHIPVIYASGKTEQKHPYIVMSLLGRHLFDLQHEQPNQHLSLHTTIRVSQQVLCGLQYLHEVGYIHRDMKSANTCVGRKDPQNVYIIDFGMCRRFVMPNGQKRPARKLQPYRGTSRYVTIRMHEELECGPADDIQSWFYTIIELHLRNLPWQGIKDQQQIHAMKKRYHNDQLGCWYAFSFYHVLAIRVSTEMERHSKL